MYIYTCTYPDLPNKQTNKRPGTARWTKDAQEEGFPTAGPIVGSYWIHTAIAKHKPGFVGQLKNPLAKPAT